MAELVALFLGQQEGADQVVARGRACGCSSSSSRTRAPRRRPARSPGSGWTAPGCRTGAGPCWTSSATSGRLRRERRARRRSCWDGVGLGDRGDELGAGGAAEFGPALRQELAHDGRQRSAALGVKACPTSERSRRCLSPVRLRIFASMCSYSGPWVMPKSSAISRPGNAVCLARRKKSPDSWSSTMNAIGEWASQPCFARLREPLVVRLRTEARLVVVDLGQVQVGDDGHGGHVPGCYAGVEFAVSSAGLAGRLPPAGRASRRQVLWRQGTAVPAPAGTGPRAARTPRRAR